MACGCGKRRAAARKSGEVARTVGRTPKIHYEIRDVDGNMQASFLTAYEARVYARKYDLPAPVSVAG